MGSIVVEIYNGDGKVLRRKTVKIHGKYRITLVAAMKVLHLIAAAKEYFDYVRKAKVKVEGVKPDQQFSSIIKKFSPIDVEVVFLEERVM